MRPRATSAIDRVLGRHVETSRILNVSDARRIAKRTLPPVVFDYIDGGADDEITMRENEAAFAGVVFQPRMATGGVAPQLGTTVLGRSVSMPLLLAPAGLVRLLHPDGAAGAARAAAGRGTFSVLSSVAGSPIGEIAPAAPGTVWFQLYAAGGRPEATRRIVEAEQVGVDVLVVTVDTPALGNRERDRRHGVTVPLRLDARGAARLGPQVLLRPRWTARMARDGVSLLERPGRAAKPSGFGMLSMVASPFTWSDVEWLRERWQGQLVTKGVLGGGDARRAVEAGSDAVVISNHGGRQLDGAPASLRVLPEVSEAVGAHAEVLLDGGVRRGSDVVKAVALGARAVFVGRPFLYGLAAAGQAGVEHVLDVFREELVRTMLLLGCASVADLGEDYLL